MEIKVKVLNIFPPLRELEKEAQMSIYFQQNTDEELSLAEIIKSKCEVIVTSQSEQIAMNIKWNKIKIASHLFSPNEEETWLYVLLDKKIKYGRAQIDSVKIKVKCAIKSKGIIANGLNAIKKKRSNNIQVNTNEGLYEQKKVQLNNLIKDLLKNPLFNSNTASKGHMSNGCNTHDDSIRSSNASTHHRYNHYQSINNKDSNNKRSLSVNQKYNYNRMQLYNSRHCNILRHDKNDSFQKQKTLNAFKSNSPSKKMERDTNPRLFRSLRKKSIEELNKISSLRQKDSYSTLNSDIIKRQSKTPRHYPQIKRLFLSKKSGFTSDEKAINNNDYYSSTRESLPDCNNNANNNNEIYLLRRKIEEKFNDLINEERELIQNDDNILEIEPSVSYLMNDLILDDDDYDDIRQAQFEEFSNDFQQSYSKDYNNKVDSRIGLKREVGALVNKIEVMNNGYRIRANEYQEQFRKYKQMFIYYSERYLQLKKMEANLKQLNEESKIMIQTKGLVDKQFSILNDNIIKTNKKEVKLLKVAFANHKQKPNKVKMKLSQILGMVLKNNANVNNTCISNKKVKLVHRCNNFKR